ncbi:MAG: DUF2029 domain-containing protein [Deltaproteobacteria bacterium]|nr:DUF2029 domain-containing protein [Deltaproteobacteria bacterium]
MTPQTQGVRTSRPSGARSPALSTTAATLLFAAAAFTLFYRHSHSGLELRDFRDGVYYAVVALLDGGNPYDTPHYLQRYPVEQGYSPYAPGFLALHLPFGLLSFETAQAVYFAFVCGLGVVLAYLAWRYTSQQSNLAVSLVMAAALLLSRPGSWNAGLGQYALEFSIGVTLALCLAPRHIWLAGFGCGLTLLKPTYGVPMSLLLLGSGRTRIWLVGVAFAALLSLAPAFAVVRAAGGIEPFATSLRASLANFSSDTTAAAATGPERIDIIGLVGFALGANPSPALELALTAAVLAAGTYGLRRLVVATNGEVTPLALVLACLTLLICTYHQTYDLVLLLVPLTAWTTVVRWPTTRRIGTLTLFALLLFPMLNYLSPQAVQVHLGIHGLASSLLTRANAVTMAARRQTTQPRSSR